MLTRSAIIISLILSIILVVQFIISQEQKEKIIILQKSIEKLSEERDILNDDNERLSGKLKEEKFSSKEIQSALDKMEYSDVPISKKLRSLKVRQYFTQSEIADIEHKLESNLTIDAERLIVDKYKLTKDEFNTIRILLLQPVKHLSAKQINQLKTLIINDEGLGGIKIGMTIEEASVVVGFDMSKTHYQYGGFECRSYGLYTGEYSQDGIRLLMINDIIDTIDIYDHKIKTDSGLSIGDLMVSVQKVYPNQYKIYDAYEWPENTITIKQKDGVSLSFTGPLFLKSQFENPAYKKGDEEKFNGSIRQISIGRGGGTVEGCL